MANMDTAEVVIAVHPPFAGLVDWKRLASPSRRWHLLTSGASKAELERTHVTPALAEVAVLDAFDEPSLERAVRARLGATAERARTRLATMIEPLQRTAARLRDRLQIPGAGEADVLPFVDKVVMKNAMRGVDALLPRFVPADPAECRLDPRAWAERLVSDLGLPLFAKPRDQNSCAGTARLETREALEQYGQRAAGPFELDELVEGDVYHLDAVIVGGVIRWFGAGRYLWPPYQTLSGAPLAGIVIGPGHGRFEELRRLNERLLRAFASVPDGCTHLEAIRRPDGRWCFLEVAARTPGWRIPEIHRLHRGVDLRLVHYQVQAGIEPDLEERPGPVAGYYCALKTDRGRIDRLNAPTFRSAHEITWFQRWVEAEDVVRSNTMADFLGAAVLWSQSWDAVWDDLCALEGFRPYTIRD
jgi:hypothetical protein